MRFVVALFLLLPLMSCTQAETGAKKEAPVREAFFLKKTSFDELAGWQIDTQSKAVDAMRKSCTRIMKKDATEAFGTYGGTYGDWQPLCEKTSLLMLSTDDEARSFFQQNFTPYEVHGDQGSEGLFTGYYEPLLKGSLEKKGKYQVPLYARPHDLITVNLGDFRDSLKGETITGRVDGEKLVPYFKRADIEAGALKDQKNEIVWVDNAVDAFFLHIQGSGQVQMEDGTILHVGYAAQNGHPYLAIGKALIERGALSKETVSMQAIRTWLEANPDQAPEIMNLNASYVFFKPLEGEGPLGAEGVPLTPNRSLAVDRKKIPYGAPLFLDAAAPEGEVRINQLMIAQDTGGAINGSVRGDYFWGAGDTAAHNAGIMKSKGRFYILLPDTVTPPENFLHAAPAAGRNGIIYND